MNFYRLLVGNGSIKHLTDLTIVQKHNWQMTKKKASTSLEILADKPSFSPC